MASAGTFDVRVFGATPDDQAYAVQAETPVEAAIEVFFRIYEAAPEVVELRRCSQYGRTVTTVRLVAARLGNVEIEVQPRRPPDR